MQTRSNGLSEMTNAGTPGARVRWTPRTADIGWDPDRRSGFPKRNGCRRLLSTFFIIVAYVGFGGILVPGSAFGLQVSAGEQLSYENVRVLAGVPRGQLQQIMEAMTVSLGVDCQYCHDVNAPESDVKPTKQIARRMMQMLVSASGSYFELMEVPSCWTCHRGSPTPEFEPLEPEVPAPPENPFPVGRPFSSEERLSVEVYENIQVYPNLPANGLQSVMEGYSQALGVGCEYCHTVGEWASDDLLMKLMARRMLEIQNGLESEYLSGDGTLSCWTCHRGEAVPETRLPVGMTTGQP